MHLEIKKFPLLSNLISLMGCKPSCDSFPTTSYTRVPGAPDEPSELHTMGNPQLSPSPFTSQHERLILELLPVKNSQAFREWIHGPFVQGSWLEFYHGFLSRNPSAPEVEKLSVSTQAKDTIKSKSAKYLAYHPVKTDWTAEDHYIRFIVTVIADNLLKGGLWSDSDWSRRGPEIAKAVYEVLIYLKATVATVPEASPPSYDA